MDTKSFVEKVRYHASEGKGISNPLLNRLARLVCSQNFKGVYAANRIPRGLLRLPRFTIIVNLGEKTASPKPLPIGHFVSLSFDRESVFYVDPYGLPCLQPRVLRFIKDSGRQLWENRVQVQHWDSPYCSLFALLFTLYFDTPRRREVAKPKLLFHRKNLRLNDAKCVYYLNKLILL